MLQDLSNDLTSTLIKLRIYLQVNGTLIRNPRLSPCRTLSELYEQCKEKIWTGNEDPRLIEKVFHREDLEEYAFQMNRIEYG